MAVVQIRQDTQQPTQDKTSHGLPGAVIFVIVLCALFVAAAVGLFVHTRLRVRRGGRPSNSGLLGWVQDKFRSRGYRQAHSGSRSARVGPTGGLDDDVWNTRLGNEADGFGPTRYDEDEDNEEGNLQPYRGGGYGHAEHGYGPRGGLDEISGDKSGKQELEDRFSAETGARQNNPFDEHSGAERSTYYR